VKPAAHNALARLAAMDSEGAIAELSEPRTASDYAVLGMAQLASERWEQAYANLRLALALGDASPATQLNIALAEERVGRDGRARMQTLATLHPDWGEVHFRLAESLRRAGALDDAVAEYERVLELDANRVEALLRLGVLLIQRNAAQAAQGLLLRCCRVAPRLPAAWDALGVALMATSDAKAAESAFSEAQRLDPASIPIALRRIDAAIAAGTAAAERARLELATLRDPLNVTQLTALGVLLDRLGRAEEAADLLETPVALAPDAGIPIAALANSQLHAGRFSQALPTLRRAVELAPHDLPLRNNLAAALNRVHRYREAREILEAVIAEHGEQPPLLCNLCNALVSLGFQQEGAELARRATRLAPEQNLGWRTLGNALAYCQGTRGSELLEVCRRAGAVLSRGRTTPALRPADPERRLRVGLLSTTLKSHPVGWLCLAAFEALDPARFDLVCFGQNPSDDPLQRRFSALASAWHKVSGQPTRRIADTIRAASIDILIDLGGWGDQATLTACAERPAPVQIKWVGMQNHSTGLAEMDWFISDRWETPAGTDRLYSERLLRLPDGYVCYSAPSYAPVVTPLPALERPGVTFGCFNNFAKVTPDVIATWSTILHRVPASRLLLKTHQFSDRSTADRIRHSFEALGVDAARIELRGSSTHRSQLAQHADVDIVLDPFPYSGGLTTCEALWMGVPVVTLAGEIFASRHSTSHLCNVGLADWVAGDAREYQDLAVRRAMNIAALRRLRQELREQMKRSPLCDHRRFGAHLAAALRMAWREACGR
jgi:predicted O-linked N-acetylglucosamine transferase (SPINDLY family)